MSEFPNIREYSPEDKESVRRVYRDAEYLEPTFSKLEDPHYKKFLYVEDGEIRGIIILEIPYLTLKIYNLYVDKEFRGEGIGTRLIKFAEKYCKENELHGIRVGTAPDNKKAQEFYQKKGFERTGKVKNYNIEGETTIFFYKSDDDF